MTPHHTTSSDTAPAALRLQLRALRHDIAPPPAVWTSIAARLDEAPPVPLRAARAWPPALAAALACAALAGWWALPPLRDAPDPALAATFAALDRDADALRNALDQAPDSPLLLHQLHRVDALRRTLEQRATL